MDYEKIEKSARLRDRVRKTVTYFFLTVWGILVLFPFYWMVLTSVKSYGAYNSEWVPKLYTLSPTLQNYVDAFTQVPLGGYFLNTIVFTVITTGLMLIVTVLAAYGFARLNFKGKDLVFALFLSLMPRHSLQKKFYIRIPSNQCNGLLNRAITFFKIRRSNEKATVLFPVFCIRIHSPEQLRLR